MVSLVVPATARFGTARISVVDPSDPSKSIGEAIIQIGVIKPDRVSLTFDSDKPWEVRTTATDSLQIIGSVSARYLFALNNPAAGAARNLKAEVSITVRPSDSPVKGCYAGYSFGMQDDEGVPTSTRRSDLYTDDQGVLKLDLAGIVVPRTKRPLAATVEVTLFDSAGPLASKKMDFAVSDNRRWWGLTKNPTLRAGAAPGKFDVDIDIASFSPSAEPENAGNYMLRLEREIDQYAWQKSGDGEWKSIRKSDPETVVERPLQPTDYVKQLVFDENGKSCGESVKINNFVRDLGVGRYAITLTDGSEKLNTVRFQTGSSTTSSKLLEPNLLALASDKPSYSPGDMIELSVNSPIDGPILVAFADGDIRGWQGGEAKGGRATIRLRARKEWSGKGLYAVATVFRGDTSLQDVGPVRAIGATYFDVAGEQVGYSVGIELTGAAATRKDGVLMAGEELSFSVCINAATGGCAASPPAPVYAAAFVVDVGLLNLTDDQTGAETPQSFFYNRRRFGLEVMDNYDRIVGRVGGDRPTRLAVSNYVSPRILSIGLEPSQPVNGKFEFKVPRLDMQQGTAQIYVVVWSNDYTASAMRDVNISSDIVVDLQAPPRLIAGDKAIIPLRLQNISHESGEFVVGASGKGAVDSVEIFRQGDEKANHDQTLKVTLPNGGAPQTLYVAVQTSSHKLGTSSLSVSLQSADPAIPYSIKADSEFNVASPTIDSMQTVSFSLDNNSFSLLNLVRDLVKSNYDADHVKISLTLASDMRSILSASSSDADNASVTRLESFIWRGLKLLDDADAKNVEDQVQLSRIIGELQSLQTADGSYLPYRTVDDYRKQESQPETDADSHDTSSTLFRTVSAYDFLTLSREAGFDVPDPPVDAAKKYIKAQLDSISGEKNCSLGALYGALVLISSEILSRDEVTSLAEECQQSEDTLVQAAAAAVLEKFGLTDSAHPILAHLQSSDADEAIGALSDVRAVIAISFLTEAKAPKPLIERLSRILVSPGNSRKMSQAVLAWIARTNAVALKGTKSGNNQNPTPLPEEFTVVQGSVKLLKDSLHGVLRSPSIDFSSLAAQDIVLKFTGGAKVYGAVTIEGLESKVSSDDILEKKALTRRYYKFQDGQEVDLSTTKLTIGERLIVVLEGNRNAITKIRDRNVADENFNGASIIIADPQPSAFEIVSGNVFDGSGINIPRNITAMHQLGDLRSLQATKDRWIAVLVPESDRERDTDGDSEDATDDASDRTRPKSNGADVEFRQAYLVRVNSAGEFTVPPAFIESFSPPAHTRWGLQGRVDVTLPSK